MHVCGRVWVGGNRGARATRRPLAHLPRADRHTKRPPLTHTPSSRPALPEAQQAQRAGAHDAGLAGDVQVAGGEASGRGVPPCPRQQRVDGDELGVARALRAGEWVGRAGVRGGAGGEQHSHTHAHVARLVGLVAAGGGDSTVPHHHTPHRYLALVQCGLGLRAGRDVKRAARGWDGAASDGSGGGSGARAQHRPHPPSSAPARGPAACTRRPLRSRPQLAASGECWPRGEACCSGPVGVVVLLSTLRAR